MSLKASVFTTALIAANVPFMAIAGSFGIADGAYQVGYDSALYQPYDEPNFQGYGDTASFGQAHDFYAPTDYVFELTDDVPPAYQETYEAVADTDHAETFFMTETIDGIVYETVSETTPLIVNEAHYTPTY